MRKVRNKDDHSKGEVEKDGGRREPEPHVWWQKP